MCRFLPAPSVRRAIDFSKHKRKGSSIFLSTPSARRATGRIDYETHRRNIFLSTPSARRATQQPERMGDRHQISIHALREEGDQKGHTERRRQAISIHALREEGDRAARIAAYKGWVFLSTPSARRATFTPETWTGRQLFLSTPSARRATYHLQPCFRQWGYFYPRPPRGGRLQNGGECCGRVVISIHALREEGDVEVSGSFPPARIFLSTPSARRATSVPFTISAN